MRKALIPAFLLLLGALVLSVTVFGEPIAGASIPFSNVIVGNTPTNPVPVDVQNTDGAGNLKVHEQGTALTREQNLDLNGNIKVHEQGTANVNVTNSSLTVAPLTPVTNGGNADLVGAGNSASIGSQTATALAIHLGPGVDEVDFTEGANIVAAFLGPHEAGNSDIVLSLARPITFDHIICIGPSDHCGVGWIGNSP
jgi:hypothetical protein